MLLFRVLSSYAFCSQYPYKYIDIVLECFWTVYASLCYNAFYHRSSCKLSVAVVLDYDNVVFTIIMLGRDSLQPWPDWWVFNDPLVQVPLLFQTILLKHISGTIVFVVIVVFLGMTVPDGFSQTILRTQRERECERYMVHQGGSFRYTNRVPPSLQQSRPSANRISVRFSERSSWYFGRYGVYGIYLHFSL